ncbi:hypothetical protein C8Q76DRAFT_799893 [Earliella scabrosa]|nr:hypothetical protein C8Q76DRAFT_799893 [Earliella scabrosa]
MAKQFDANNAQNLVEIEKQFAVKAVEHAQTYWNLLEKVPPRDLKLTKCVCLPHLSWRVSEYQPYSPRFSDTFPAPIIRPPAGRIDDEIFEHAMQTFPELAENEYEKVVKLDEDWMKSDEGKKRWRDFIQQYEKKVKDYNFGSLIRTDARQEYSETNTIFVTRIQFYVYEIARNRLGLNDQAHEIAKEEAAKEKEKAEKEKARAEREKQKKKRN